MNSEVGGGEAEEEIRRRRSRRRGGASSESESELESDSHSHSNSRSKVGIINLHLTLPLRCWGCIMMENKTTRRKMGMVGEGREVEFQRTLSQGKGSGRRLLGVSYFSLESLLLLVCLTASLLILPLILPPLPPPPFLLLLLPIGILVLLMFLAFMPSNVRDLSYSYV